MARSAWRALTVAVLALFLGGCFGARFVYGQLDWFIAWRLNGFFDLEREQERELRRLVSENLDWVAVRQLPAYAELLRVVARDVETVRVEPPVLDARFLQMIALWDDFLRHVTPDAAGFLHGFSDAQTESFLDNLGENNEELWEEFAGSTPERRRERREKAIVRSVQRFSGRLDANQRGLVAAAVASMHDNSAAWMAGRRGWQARFAALLQARPPLPEFEARLGALLLDPNVADAPDYRARVAENQAIVFRLLADLSRSFDDGQRERFVRRLRNLADDLEAISRRQTATATVAAS